MVQLNCVYLSNFHPLEVVGCGSETQLQVSEYVCCRALNVGIIQFLAPPPPAPHPPPPYTRTIRFQASSKLGKIDKVVIDAQPSQRGKMFV